MASQNLSTQIELSQPVSWTYVLAEVELTLAIDFIAQRANGLATTRSFYRWWHPTSKLSTACDGVAELNKIAAFAVLKHA